MFTTIVVAVFVVVLVGFVLVSRRMGARAHYLEDWRPAEDDSVLFVDDGADFYVVARFGQAVKMTFARRGRAKIRITRRHVVVAEKVAMADKWMITHVLLRDGSPAPADAERIDSGLMSTGSTTFVLSAGEVTAERDGDKPYVRLVPQHIGSATNIEHCRLYSDQTDAIVALLAPR
jgi:hypothetical protein